MSNKTTQKKNYSVPEVIVTAKLTQQAKQRKNELTNYGFQ